MIATRGRMIDSGHDKFIVELTANQNRLFAYILSLVGNRELAKDLLQQANLVLWHKSDEFEPGSNFVGWAFKIAYFEVLAHRKRVGRDRHIFDDNLFELVADALTDVDSDYQARLAALSRCLAKLAPEQSDLIHRRYTLEQPIQLMAEELDRGVSAIKSALRRIRGVLVGCIDREISMGESR
jgi:RNA polymerase sigma-70 factor (ECF subfamily)